MQGLSHAGKTLQLLQLSMFGTHDVSLAFDTG